MGGRGCSQSDYGNLVKGDRIGKRLNARSVDKKSLSMSIDVYRCPLLTSAITIKTFLVVVAHQRHMFASRIAYNSFTSNQSRHSLNEYIRPSGQEFSWSIWSTLSCAEFVVSLSLCYWYYWLDGQSQFNHRRRVEPRAATHRLEEGSKDRTTIHSGVVWQRVQLVRVAVERLRFACW